MSTIIVASQPASAALLQALHRNHAPPSGCYITGDPSVGYALHLRALDATATEVNKMRRFTDLCNAGASVIARGAAAVTMLGQAPAGQLMPVMRLCCLLVSGAQGAILKKQMQKNELLFAPKSVCTHSTCCCSAAVEQGLLICHALNKSEGGWTASSVSLCCTFCAAHLCHPVTLIQGAVSKRHNMVKLSLLCNLLFCTINSSRCRCLVLVA